MEYHLHTRPTAGQRSGMLIFEAVVAMTLMSICVALFGWTLTQHHKNADLLHARQRALLAAEAALSDIRAGATPTAEQFKSRFCGAELSLSTRAGEGDWTGMMHATVSVSMPAKYGRWVRVEASGYLLEKQP